MGVKVCVCANVCACVCVRERESERQRANGGSRVGSMAGTNVPQAPQLCHLSSLKTTSDGNLLHGCWFKPQRVDGHKDKKMDSARERAPG